MFRFFDRPNNLIPSRRRAPQDSKRLWLLLGSSSFLIHLGLIYWVGLMNLRSSELTSELDGTPIDLIELSETDTGQASPTQPLENSSRQASDQAGEAPLSVQSPPIQPAPQTEDIASSEISIGPEPEVLPSLPAQDQIDAEITTPESTENSEDEVAVQPEVTEDPAEVTEDPAPPIEPAPDPTLPSAAQSAATVPDSSELSPSPSSAEASSRSSPAEGQSPAFNHPAQIERIATATPTPLLTTQSIDVPIPDVSGRLPDPADPASHLADNVTQQIMIPSRLTASLTATALPPHRDQILDETAQPTTEVQTFASNSVSSPCRVTPEIVRYLGKTVAMQVITNEKGRVVHTITQESSQSLAYDELATCLVKNWTFEPAIARGQPVANDGLVVHITIDRS